MKIRFQPDDLKAVCRNPRAPLECNRVGLALSTNLVGANGIRFVWPLAEITFARPARPSTVPIPHKMILKFCT